MGPSSSMDPLGANISPSDSTHETHQHISMTPALQEYLTEQPIMETPSSEEGETHANWKRSCSGIFQELRRRNRLKKINGAPGARQSLWTILKTSRFNVLLIFIPLSWIFYLVKLNNIMVFVFSFLAIIPLSKLIAFATDDLSLRLGQTLATLLDVTLKNAIEMIFAIVALLKCQLTVVQSSLIGSILGNLLLVLGMCFFAGGTRFSEQGFGTSATRVNLSMLTLSVTSVLVPAAFHNVIQPTSDSIDPLTDAQEGHDILAISHGVAIIQLFIYICYLVFQLFSHRKLYDGESEDVRKTVEYTNYFARELRVTNDLEASSNGEEEERPQMSSKMAIALLIVVTVIVAITANFLVDSIESITSSGHISKKFVGLILVPIVGNAADYFIIATASVENKLIESLGVAVGSSIQIALFVFPFVTTLGWFLGKPLTLLFDPFDSVVLFLSVLTLKYVVQGGKSNWLHGMILMCLYVIVGVTYWFYPGSDPAGVLTICP